MLQPEFSLSSSVSGVDTQTVLNTIYWIAYGHGIKYGSSRGLSPKSRTELINNTASHWRKSTFSVMLVYRDSRVNSNKFWGIEKVSTTTDDFMIVWGRVGTKGSQQLVSIPHPELICSSFQKASKKLDEKLRNGYFFSSGDLACEKVFTRVSLASNGDILLGEDTVRYVGFNDDTSPGVCTLMDNRYNTLALAPVEVFGIF